MKLFDDFFNYFFRKIFLISSGAPIPNFYWQTGFFTAGNVILQKKLLFCHHLSNLPEDSLRREVYDLQTRNHSLPSLFLEMKEHLASLGIDDLKTVPKTIWKKMVKGYIKNLNKNQLLDNIEKYKKLSHEEMSKEEFERKEYFYK